MPSEDNAFVITQCQHIKINGVRCASPAMRGTQLCYFHQRWRSYRPAAGEPDPNVKILPNSSGPPPSGYHLPLLEDADSVQVAIFTTLRELRSGAINYRTASLMLYGLQIAAHNLKRTDLQPVWEEVTVQEQPPLSAEDFDGADEDDFEDDAAPQVAAELPAARPVAPPVAQPAAVAPATATAPAKEPDSLAEILARALAEPEPASIPEEPPAPEVMRARLARMAKAAHEEAALAQHDR